MSVNVHMNMYELNPQTGVVGFLHAMLATSLICECVEPRVGVKAPLVYNVVKSHNIIC